MTISTLPPTEQLLSAALGYARRGWPVFPCHSVDPEDHICTCGKTDCDSPGKHPLTPNGLRDATINQDTIRRWWTEAPIANIAIATGEKSNLWVLDLDGEAGINQFFKLCNRHDKPHDTLITLTGGEGAHYYFTWPIEAMIANRTNVGGLNIDVRGNGGYVLGVPSYHLSGRCYEWEASPTISVKAAPAWLLNWVTTEHAAKISIPPSSNNGNGTLRVSVGGADLETRVRAYLAKCPPAISGQDGHKHTFAICCAVLQGFNLTPETALPLLADWNAACQPPWNEKELLHKLNDAAKKNGERGKFLNGQAGQNTPAGTVMALPQPVPASQLAPVGTTVNWKIHGYLAEGHITLLISLWKAGKSTFVALEVRALEDGQEFIGQTTKPSRVLIVSEEHRVKWAERRDKLGLRDHIHFLPRDLIPFVGRPTFDQWNLFVDHLSTLVKEHQYGVVVLDTLARLSPVDDENDAAKVQAALSPLHKLTETGVAVQLVHHPKKGDAAEGQAARGSGALPGFVDIIIEMRRTVGSDRRCRQRTLTSYSRFDETPEELVIELDQAGTTYAVVGTKADADRLARQTAIRGILPTVDAGSFTVDEVLSHWPEGSKKPSRTRLSDILSKGLNDSLWKRMGSGTKGDPHRYWSQ